MKNPMILAVAALMSMLALAGCTSNSQNDDVLGPMTDVATTATYPAGCTSAVGYSATTGVKCDSGVVTLPAGCKSTVGYSSTTGVKCDSTVTTTTTTTTTFPPAPDGVRHFTVDASWQGCPTDGSWFYSPQGGAEWYVNTGSATVDIVWKKSYVQSDMDAGTKTMSTNGGWGPIGITSDAFSFCLYLQNPGTDIVGLALPPPQKG